jgi:trk system potassium uptake protein TrkH
MAAADPLERSAASYMHKQFAFVVDDQDVATGVSQMQLKKAETMIVVRNDGTPVGIVTDSDILDKVVVKGEDTDRVYLRSIMSSPLITIPTSATVKDALQLMKLNAIKRIPVRDGQGIVGIVTQKALADAIRVNVLERTFRKYRSSIRDRYKAILANLGFVLQFAGILMVVPALVGTVLGETQPVVGIYLAVVGLFGTGFLFAAYGERGPLSLKESSIVVLSSFVLLSFYGSIPYMHMNPFWQGIDPLSLFVNSFFESASGFTTTGASTIAAPENLPDSFNFYRSYTHWIGGLSFVYLVILLFYPEKKLNTIKGLLGLGSTLPFKKLSIVVSVIFTTYLAILTVSFLMLGNPNPVFNVSLVISAITGGGFVPHSTFLASAAQPSLIVLMIGMVISALPFAAHYSVYSKASRKRIVGIEVLLYFTLLGLSSFVFFLITETNSLMSSSFHVFSASTNSGFQFIDLATLAIEAKILLIVVMFIGGSAYSAAGGIKIGRLIVLFRNLGKKKGRRRNGEALELVAFTPYNTLKRYDDYPSRSSKESKFEKGESKVVLESTIVIGLFTSVAIVTGLLLSYLNGLPFLDSLFESTAALTTTGLTTGLISLNLDLISKSILIVNMIVGKFEIIILLYIFFGSMRRRLR